MVVLAVLATLLVALAIATRLSEAGLDAQRLADYTQAREANYLVARSAFEMGLEVLRSDTNQTDGPGDNWAVGELDVEWEGRKVALRIVDEESRFPLGRLQKAPDQEKVLAEALVRLVRRAGGPAPEESVDRLLDWVDPDLVRRPSGAELGDYGRNRVKDAPLDSVAELQTLPGWSTPPALPAPRRRPPPPLESLKGATPGGDLELPETGLPTPGPQTPGAPETSDWSDWLTVHSSGKINVNTAAPELLTSLDPGMTEVTVQEIVNRRQDEAFQGGDDLRQVPGVDADLLFRLEKLVGYESRNFEIRAAVGEPPGRVVLRGVVRRGGGPMKVLFWEVQ